MIVVTVVQLLSDVCLFCDPMDCSPQGFSDHGISQAEYWSGLPFPPPGDFPDSGIEPASLASSLPGGFFITEPSGKPSQAFGAG